MVRTTRQTRDNLLQDLHNRWLTRLHDSGLPIWVADIYSFSPLSIHSSIGVGDDKHTGLDENTHRSAPLKNGIPADHYYKLLDWRDNNLSEFKKLYGPISLNNLSTEELKRLYRIKILDDLPF